MAKSHGAAATEPTSMLNVQSSKDDPDSHEDNIMDSAAPSKVLPKTAPSSFRQKRGPVLRRRLREELRGDFHPNTSAKAHLSSELLMMHSKTGVALNSIQNPDGGFQLLLRLENWKRISSSAHVSRTSTLVPTPFSTLVPSVLVLTPFSESILVGTIVHAEFLEFYFFDAKPMSACVGVGLPRAKVILHNDLSISIEETTVHEWGELMETWTPFLDHKDSHLVMKVDKERSRSIRDGHVQTLARDLENRETLSRLSRLCGVGFACHSQYVDETYDAAEVSWPLLYDMALFILTSNYVQCNETDGTSSAQGSGSLQPGNIQSKMVDKLNEKRDDVFNTGNFQDEGGDGDEAKGGDGDGDDDPPVVLKVTVHPRTKHDLLGTQQKPYGLELASIGPKLVFEFCQNRECRRISVKTQTTLALASEKKVLKDRNFFGWYHTGIQISFGCEDTEGHPESGRVALLKQNSCRILNPRTSYKYTIAKSMSCSKADTYTAGGEGGFKLGGIEMQGSSSCSTTQQVATSNGGNIEIEDECICKGFSFMDQSSTELPARASFLLSYPLQHVNIWNDREFLQRRGLFSTIEPSIEGTWIPLNGLDASPYLFKAVRSLKMQLGTDRRVQHNQEYVLPFYVNHAMSHLKSQRRTHIEDQQSVPNVLNVGSMY